ncbi:hypothetical protein GQQ23_19430 [Pantoea agglomerans]|uniref:PIN-like domain-containing protein n=1 Tax=Enterobacter agglomerans TaxID=549 RepID=UPI0013CDA699|nr:PIN-like domain-containing protein [Pantoea agglomerans]NEG64487.1 hypothetical protein [Pantoea agglomerans]
MKNLFGGFYGASEPETKEFWTSPDSVFVFDTNALLLLYRCERETREAFFSQWEKIRERVWLPYHVCLEYQRNRLTAIKDHVKELRNAGAHISSRIESAADLNKFEVKYAATIRRYDSLRGKVSELAKELQGTVDRFVQEQIETRISEADFLTNHDTVRDRISDLIGERIGNPPTEAEINQLQQTGEIRFSKEIPPGFEDAKTKKDETFTFNKITYKRKFGDWFIWHEILKYASENKPIAVIFVTNDNKKDWLYETGGQTRGPHESLKTELAEQGEETHFLMYSSASFLNAANKNLEGQATSPEAIKELERVSVRVYMDEEPFLTSRLKEQLEQLNIPSLAQDYGSFTKHLFNEPNWYKITDELKNLTSPIPKDLIKLINDTKVFTPELKNEVINSLIKNNKLYSIDYYDINHNHKNDNFHINEDDANKTDEDEKP